MAPLGYLCCGLLVQPQPAEGVPLGPGDGGGAQPARGAVGGGHHLGGGQLRPTQGERGERTEEVRVRVSAWTARLHSWPTQQPSSLGLMKVFLI